MTWLAGMEGIPTDYRHMEGYGVNTFTLINAQGKDTYVKFHWRPKEGKCLLSCIVTYTHQLKNYCCRPHASAMHLVFPFSPCKAENPEQVTRCSSKLPSYH